MPVGEDRIPRRNLPEFEEIEGGLAAGIFQHGWKIWKVALDDTNQYGPHAMILLLVITATITGAVLQIIGMMG
ncbi:MAG TPA: hypothetical protein EYN46_02575 [Candidatus Poseidoniales archaeon]|nr:MAG: hypothetical protein CXX80_10890 [Euryarchaeota archaeon]HIA39774.1 hypothetical protein [Candidatus Poseidoniales archaeon]PXY74765.1 MAG: hypothetical protein CXX80_06235 [Euryarchaeota archaeon]PXY77224.1 MAG: hypothetical protein CXX80_01270 [Euryarchaeota archaeon]HIA89766.1 hypothetical protein [Candidatus Poseidoniales archaeon]